MATTATVAATSSVVAGCGGLGGLFTLTIRWPPLPSARK